MSILDFAYELNIRFSEPVTNHNFVLRCIPLDDCTQIADNIKVEIAPYSTLWRTASSAENGTLMGDVKFPHFEFGVKVGGQVWRRDGVEGNIPHPMYLTNTQMTQPDERLKETALSFAESKRDYKLCIDIMNIVHNILKYKSDVTDANTTAAEAVKLGRGVCQDYAHIYCCLMRLLGVPTRYVAGLGFSIGETHAWNECYLDGRWYAFDATHNKPVTDGYVKFAEGVDARQCALNRGVFTPVGSKEVVQTQTVKAVVNIL